MNESTNYRVQLSALNIISMAPVVVLTIFSALVVYLHSTEQLTASDDFVPVFTLAVPLTLVVCLAAAYFAFASVMKKVDRSMPLKGKVAKYQNAFIVRMGILEIPGIFGAIAAFMSGNFYFLGAPLLVAIILLLFRPSRFAIAEDLALSPGEKSALETPAATSR